MKQLAWSAVSLLALGAIMVLPNGDPDMFPWGVTMTASLWMAIR